MADASEDLLSPSSNQDTKPPPNINDTAEDQDQDQDEDGEEIVDFRFLNLSSSASSKIPSRGMKDFEPHGTQLQVSTLDASRDAMHNVLKEERVHAHDIETAVYDAGLNGAWVTKVGGKWAHTTGKYRTVLENDVKVSKLFLLPEEVLWLVERGSLDLRWPAESIEGEEQGNGLPMSLQAAHALLLGNEEEGGLSLDKFIVYQYLRRGGYIVLRAGDNWHNVPDSQESKEQTRSSIFWPLWQKLFAESEDDKLTRRKAGPLVKPGLYRDYKSIYQSLSLIPYHDPLSTPTLQQAPLSGPAITYHVYKPRTSFKKSSPGPPDFYIGVLNAQESGIPTEHELDTLLRQTPFHPPTDDKILKRTITDGARNVLLAIVDRGITSFINVSDAGFGNHKLWQREVRRGSKRGGFRGRGRGRGGFRG